MSNRSVGSEHEKMAAEYLSGQGYNIIETNFFCKGGEIDIIARDGEYLCFIEVKYRRSASEGYPEEAVNIRKAGRITRSALFYMNLKRIPDSTPCRFDVVAIFGDRITLYKNAFEAVL